MSRPEEAYLAWLSMQRCCVCGRFGVEIAHVQAARSPKTGLLLPRSHKVALSNVCAIPLCADDHRLGPQSIHALGEEAFGVLHGGVSWVPEMAFTFLALYVLEGHARI